MCGLPFITLSVGSLDQETEMSAACFGPRHRGPKQKLGAGYRTPSLKHTSHSYYFSSFSVVSRAFFALCVYSKFGHHPQSLGYLCAKFRLCCDRHCLASPWRKITYSITHPAYLMLRGPKLLLRNVYRKIYGRPTVLRICNMVMVRKSKAVIIQRYFCFR